MTGAAIAAPVALSTRASPKNEQLRNANMKKPELPSRAERRAEEAQRYSAFTGINLHKIRASITELLSLIGRQGLFEEYTKHDISHIDKLLSMLDWIIPTSTQSAMSPADWLLTVLCIYFHDLGMLITRSEYDQRLSSGFPQYKEAVFSGTDGEDYNAKVDAMEPAQAERFLYQEFVRTNHAKRIREWITGQSSNAHGVTSSVESEINRLLEALGPKFRRDLGNVCESHHLDDLYDLEKYRVSQPYGDSDAETANLHYAAILLRTVDLLHVSRDRTPSLSFRLLNPADPISQEEWYKQMAVVTVRSKPALNKEGHADPALPRDTVEIHAFFESPRGFFALTRYIDYVEKQLQMSFEWCREARELKGIPHEFPWRYIDDSTVETEGFLSKQFEFTLDQAKILDLLTGHTLYNDLRVVLRELVQNSLDAVRLHALINRSSPSGSVVVRWDSRKRELLVEDHGTGMTQEIIERHLLKVGSSRYQDPDFRKHYPNFSPISRFGIGVLSTFMISDEVEILTCHEQDQQARQLSLRSVHGKYLIRLLNKSTEDVKSIFPHGTRIRLKVRQSVRMPDVLQTAKAWIVLPECEVTVDIDGSEHNVGFGTLEEAVKDYCAIVGIDLSHDGGDFKRRIVEERLDGLTVAFPVEWSESYKEWSFVSPKRKADNSWEPLGICVEGIRVTFETPGFVGFPLIAIANATGSSAPKTNVARSGLETTPERDATLAKIYKSFMRHVANEVTSLENARGFSRTWSAREGKWLMRPLLHNPGETAPIDRHIFSSEAYKAPVLIMEKEHKRTVVSPAHFQAEPTFWAIDCGLFSSAEWLLREVPGEGSLAALSDSMGGQEFPLPKEPILCGLEGWQPLDRAAFIGKEVSEIKIFETQRRVDLRWSQKGTPPRWLSVPDYARLPAGRERSFDIFVATCQIPIDSQKTLHAIRAFGQLYILHSSPLAKIIIGLLRDAEREKHPSPVTIMLGAVCAAISHCFATEDPEAIPFPDLLNQGVARFGRQSTDEAMRQKYFPMLLDAVHKETWESFDTTRWSRSLSSWI